MAARINVKLLLIVIIVIGTIGAGLGAIYLINTRTDTTRFVEAGDELLQAGEPRRAIIQYRRAIGRDRMNLEYIDRLRAAIQAVEPATETEAFDYFMEYVTTYQHVVTHYPGDASKHIELLELVHRAATEQLGVAFWDLLENGARTMLSRVSPADAQYDHGKFYLAAAVLTPARVLVLAHTVVDEAYELLDQYIESNPGDEAAVSVLVDARLTEADHRRLDNRIAAMQSLDAARVALRGAVDREMTGTWLGVALPRFDAMERRLEVRDRTFSRSVLDQAIRNSFESMRAEGTDADINIPLLLRLLANVEERRSEADMPDPLLAIDDLLARRSDSTRLMGLRAQLLMGRGDFAEAGRMATKVFESPPGRVSMAALRQWQLRRFAAATLFDVAVVEWEQASARAGSGADVSHEVEEIRKALERVRLVTMLPDEDAQFLYAQARYDFVRGEFGRAASGFDRLIREERILNPQILVYSAVTLERQGQLGLAMQRIEGALTSFPTNPVLLRTKLRIAEGLGDEEVVRSTIEQLLAVEPESDVALRARSRLAERGVGGSAEDSLLEYFQNVTTMISEQRYAEATASLEERIERIPDDLRLYRALAEVRFAAGDRPGARRAVERALVQAPGNRFFTSLLEVAEIEDPVEAVTRWWLTFHDDPKERLFAEIREVTARRNRLQQVAEQEEAAGNIESAEEQRGLARRFGAREDVLMREAVSMYPLEPLTLELRLNRAIRAGDWREAESVIVDARRVDADLAGGSHFEGRMRMARGDYVGAARSFQEASRRLGYSAEVFFGLGASLAAVGNFTDALEALEQAYAINPTDERIVRNLADAYVQIGNLPRATEMVRVLYRRQPSNVDLRERWLSLEGQIGNSEIELRERRRVYRDHPDDLRNLISLVHFLERRIPEHRTILDESGEPRIGLSRWQLLSPTRQREEIAAERTRRQAEVDRILAAFRPSNRESPVMLLWAMLSADVALGRGQGDQGEAVLRSLVQSVSDEPKLVAILALGDLQRRRGRIEDALQTYRSLESEGFGERDEFLWSMANTYLNSGRPLDAIPFVERMVRGDLNDRLRIWSVSTQSAAIQIMDLGMRDVEFSIVEQLRRAGHLEDARKRYDAAVAGIEPSTLARDIELELLTAEADTAWSRGDTSGAERIEATIDARAAEYVRAIPGSEVPFLIQANRALQRFRRTRDDSFLQEATRRLSSAEQYAPLSQSVLRLQYMVQIETGNRQQAESVLRQHLDSLPASDQVRRMLVEHLIRDRRYERAVVVVQEAIDRIGSSAAALPWHLLASEIHSRGGNAAAAADALGVAFQLDPSPGLLGRFCKQMLARPNLQARDFQRIQDEIRRRPEFLNEDPSLRLVLAQVLIAQRREQEALAQIRESYRHRKDRVERGVSEPLTLSTWVLDLRGALPNESLQRVEEVARDVAGEPLGTWEMVGVGRMWIAGGSDGASRGLELLEQAYQSLPNDEPSMQVFMLMELGNASLQARRYPEAADYYQRLLVIQPNQGIALNNLAYTLSEHLRRPADALPYAAQAVSLMPASWSAIDTYARIHFHLGRLDEALQLQRRSVVLQEHPTNLAHLAEVYLAQGDFVRARAEIERAAGALTVQSEPDEVDRARIDRIRREIATKSGGS